MGVYRGLRCVGGHKQGVNKDLSRRAYTGIEGYRAICKDR